MSSNSSAATTTSGASTSTSSLVNTTVPNTHITQPSSHDVHGETVYTTVMKLYNSSTSDSELDEVFTHFISNIHFRDPITDVTGIDKYQAQFRSLKKLFSFYNPLEADVSYSAQNKVIIDTTIQWGKNIQLRQLTIVKYNNNGQIINHEDLWVYAKQLEQTPILGSLYNGWRTFFGRISSTLIKRNLDGDWQQVTEREAAAAADAKAETSTPIIDEKDLPKHDSADGARSGATTTTAKAVQ